MEKILETAYAKVNLGLDVLNKSTDGYHEVRMVMQSIGLCDAVELEEGENLSVTTDSSMLGGGPENLAWQAAELLARRCMKKPNVHIRINKKIFLAAGLAGGSSDAAAVLRGLNRLWKLKMQPAELEKIAAELGSDVPFCIAGGTMLAEGRGEILTELQEVPPLIIVLAKPKLAVATGWVYGNFCPQKVAKRPDIDGMLAALKQGQKDALLACCGNVLESVTIPAHPIIAEIKKRMLASGAEYAMMSGSGPTVFGVADSLKSAQKILAALTELDLEMAVTTTVKKERI